ALWPTGRSDRLPSISPDYLGGMKPFRGSFAMIIAIAWLSQIHAGAQAGNVAWFRVIHRGCSSHSSRRDFPVRRDAGRARASDAAGPTHGVYRKSGHPLGRKAAGA